MKPHHAAPAPAARRPAAPTTRAAGDATVQATAASGWRATLPSGVGVEMVGVSGQAEHVWWKPDGTPLPAGPWEATEFLAFFPTLPDHTLPRQFVMRLTHTEGQALKEAAQTYDAPLTMSGSTLMRPQEAGMTLQGVFGGFPPTRTTCTLRYGLATGPWQMAATVGPRLGAAPDGQGWRRPIRLGHPPPRQPGPEDRESDPGADRHR